MSINVGGGQFFEEDDLPEDIKEELRAILSNIRAIHGPILEEYIKFHISVHSLIAFAMRFAFQSMRKALDSGEDFFKELDEHNFDKVIDPKLAKVLMDMASSVLQRHAEAMFVTPEQFEVSLNTVKTMNSVANQMEGRDGGKK